MIKNYKQSGFYLLETLISLQLFFITIFTLFPIQHQIFLEKKVLKEKNEIVHFLGETMKKAVINSPNKQEFIYENFIITFTNTESLLKGCAEWTDAKENENQFCLFVKEE